MARVGSYVVLALALVALLHAAPVRAQGAVRPLPVTATPLAVAVDATDGRVYVAGERPDGTGSLAALDGAGGRVATVPLAAAGDVAVDSATGRVYAASAAGDSLSVFDGGGALPVTFQLTLSGVAPAGVAFTVEYGPPEGARHFFCGAPAGPACVASASGTVYALPLAVLPGVPLHYQVLQLVPGHPPAVAPSVLAAGDLTPTKATTIAVASRLAPRDTRYFAQTGFRIDNDTIWDYVNRRGGLPTFGYPVSRTFFFQGFTVQFFQRRILQLGPNGGARLLNLLDPGILPYNHFNGSTFPSYGSSLVATAPNPTDQPAVLAWVAQHAPNSFNGQPVNFLATFQNTVSAHMAFPNSSDPSLLPGIDLELWGVPTSQPLVDPNNHHFIYLRWQRGIMHYDAGCRCTQGILLADYLKAVLTLQHLPLDLATEARGSPLYGQYDPGMPHWVHNPARLPASDLTEAFTPE